MRADEDAVGGFFEDLPVLVFVLAGVSVLVSSAVWAERQLAEDREGADMEFAAEMLLEVICVNLFPEPDMPPTIESLREQNFTETALEVVGDRSWAVSISERYPSCEMLSSSSGGDGGAPTTVASCSRLVNAVDGEGLTVVVEVRTCVWQDE